MENFIVSARKYRPATFRSVVGQSALTTTLKNAIQSKHLAHAYLFCGPRGVGKTTCARIFAKTINCQNPGQDAEACNACESCVSFNEQRSFNIHELDAASNNGVEDIRSLIDQVRVPPQIGKYSVYIIDEVHMLSSGAFNAFLKTLEEPPAHAIFILATTEKHKIIPTILSRCQIYDFNRISVSDTVEHLKYVAGQEGVNIDENALNIIAQKSDGGMRDALSIFDQLVSFCGNNIDYQGVIENLNVLDYEYYFRLVDAFLNTHVPDALLIFNEILNKGFDAFHFITGLSSHFRDLLVCRDPKTIILMEVGADIGRRYQEQARNCDDAFLIQALKITNDCELNYRISNNKRLHVELSLIRLSQLTDEKKKDLLTVESLPPLKKIATEQNQQEAAAAPIPQPKVITPQETVKSTPPPLVESQITAAKKPSRSISISINSPAVKTVAAAATEPNQPAEEIAVKEDKPYTSADFEKAWTMYADEIPKIVSVVSYIRNTMPVQVSERLYQLPCTNIFQESEIKKLLPALAAFIRKKLQNQQIGFTTIVLETADIPRSINPEEVLKKMTQQNPALEILRNNLSLEID
jgi:DNA polymerase III subunit gamma/tau